MVCKFKSLYFIFLLPLALAVYSCAEKGGSELKNNQLVQKEDLIRANQFLVGKDMELINAYINRRNWNMDFSKTGLGYQIYEHGTGPEVRRGNMITLQYTLSLLDGQVCYSSGKDGLKTFIVGQGGVEAGLEEGILMLREGDKARFILPPFLAHGLIGDQNKIPPRAVVIYEIEVENVSIR